MMPLPKNFYRQLARYYDLIFIPPACMGIGLWIGWAIDLHFQSDPWGKMVFVLLGFGTGLYQIFRFLLRRKSGNDSS